jgi:hypothetical protein
MSPQEVKLPNLERAEFVSRAFISPEWVIDPAFLTRLKENIAVKIVGLRMQHLSERMRLEAQIKESEARMFDDMAQLLGK